MLYLILKKTFEATTSDYCTDCPRNFDDLLLRRMGDTPSVTNHQNFLDNQHINYTRDDSTAFLRLIGEEEVNYIFSNNEDQSISGIAYRAFKTYKSRPGFFTPYKNTQEFAGELIAPIVYPLAGIISAGYSAFFAAATAVVFVGSVFVAAGVGLSCTKDNEYRDEVLAFPALALQFMGVAILTAVVSALLAAVSFPHSLLSLVTRSVATVAFSSDDVSSPLATIF